MNKRFNVTGVCLPTQHYMADTSAKFARIMEMIAQGEYFTINRPRQYGKTTTLFQLTAALNATTEYLALRISFEGVGDTPFEAEAALSKRFLGWLAKSWAKLDAPMGEWLLLQSEEVSNFEQLSDAITRLIIKAKRKVVVLIDEVDKSSDNQLFLHFIAMLRNKYLERSETETFHSVVLVGIHDVKTLKLKLRPEEERKYNSPWNIAADFKVDMNLQVQEIQPMLEEYARDRGVTVDAKAVADRLFYYTAGYPFLTCKLCKIFDEEMLPQKTALTWTTEDVDRAASQLITESNTNFDELSKNLDNNPALYELTQAIAIEGKTYFFEPNDPVASLGILYGIFANRNGLAIHNRIYQEVITNKMSFRIQRENDHLIERYDISFSLPNQQLDIKKLLLKFQELMKAEYNKKERDFLERQGRLVFLAFLKPILNGHGYAFKEPQAFEERRLDLFITYYQHRYVVELKLWRGAAAHQRGLDQLASYLDGLGLDEGTLLIFDHSGVKQWKDEEVVHNGKRIFAVWV